MSKRVDYSIMWNIKNLEQNKTKYLSIEKWLNKLRIHCEYCIEYYAADKKKGVNLMYWYRKALNCLVKWIKQRNWQPALVNSKVKGISAYIHTYIHTHISIYTFYSTGRQSSLGWS